MDLFVLMSKVSRTARLRARRDEFVAGKGDVQPASLERRRLGYTLCAMPAITDIWTILRRRSRGSVEQFLRLTIGSCRLGRPKPSHIVPNMLLRSGKSC